MLAPVLGWVGTLGTFAVYLMMSRGRLDANSVTYAAVNALCGLAAGVAAGLYGAWPSAAANLAWAAVGAYTLVVCLRQKSRSAPAEIIEYSTGAARLDYRVARAD
ncbi:hypothetical protein [Gordonia sp. NPDC003376]